MSLQARKYCFLCYLALTERSFEKSASFQTECLQLSLSQSLLFYQIMQHDDSSSTQDEVMHLGQHFSNICSTNAKPDENCAENPLPLPEKCVHVCTEGAQRQLNVLCHLKIMQMLNRGSTKLL